MNKLILASSSHYRKLLLGRLQLPFSCHSPNVDEAHLAGETGAQMAERLAIRKAQAVAALFPDAAIIGSDQVAELLPNTTHSQKASQPTAGHIILGKPLTHGGAIAQLRQQSGRTLSFHSGVAVMHQGLIKSFVDTTEVDFRELTDEEIEQYVQRDQPYDCAGSFKAESLGITLFRAIRSDDPTSLIGLPLIRLSALLRELSPPLAFK